MSLVLASLLAVGLAPASAPQEPTRESTQGADLEVRQRGRHELARAKSPAGKAVLLGLDWLSRHQSADGRWDADGFGRVESEGPGQPVHDVGVSGLALLAFLGDGVTDKAGPYQESVRKGIAWLVKQQAKNGLFGVPAHHTFIYDHAIASYAICEAYGLTGRKDLAEPAQRGLDYLEHHRNPYGAWRYQPRDNDNDMSVTSWAMLACTTGRSFDLKVKPHVFQLVGSWVDQLTDPATGKVGYTKRGEMSSRNAGNHLQRFPPELGEAMTAAGLLTRLRLGQSAGDGVLARGIDLLLAKPPRWDDGAIDHYYWFFATQALSLAGGDAWREWNATVVPMLAEKQQTKGDLLGSWDPVGVWGEQGGRIYSTALMIMTLQAPYRSATFQTRARTERVEPERHR